jgi:hypothetical protein
MSNIESVDLTQSAKSAVLYANTPTYLLDKLKRDAAIQILLHGTSPEELFETLCHAGPAENALDIARKYVLLVAVASSSLTNKWEALAKLDLSDLEWGKLILKMAQAQDVPTHQAFTMSSSVGNPNEFRWNQRELVGH